MDPKLLRKYSDILEGNITEGYESRVLDILDQNNIDAHFHNSVLYVYDEEDVNRVEDVLMNHPGIEMPQIALDDPYDSGPEDMDGDFDSAMASAGHGSDEDYGDYGGFEESVKAKPKFSNLQTQLIKKLENLLSNDNIWNNRKMARQAYELATRLMRSDKSDRFDYVHDLLSTGDAFGNALEELEKIKRGEVSQYEESAEQPQRGTDQGKAMYDMGYAQGKRGGKMSTRVKWNEYYKGYEDGKKEREGQTNEADTYDPTGIKHSDFAKDETNLQMQDEHEFSNLQDWERAVAARGLHVDSSSQWEGPHESDPYNYAHAMDDEGNMYGHFGPKDWAEGDLDPDYGGVLFRDSDAYMRYVNEPNPDSDDPYDQYMMQHRESIENVIEEIEQDGSQVYRVKNEGLKTVLSIRGTDGAESTRDVAVEGWVDEDIIRGMHRQWNDFVKEVGGEPQMFTKLSDAGPNYAEGPNEVWYWKKEYSRDMMMGASWLQERRPELMPSEESLPQTHVLIGTLAESDLENIYMMMQGERWSPEGQARNMIQQSGTGHTSMSMGDVVKKPDGIYMVDSWGFYKIGSGPAQESVEESSQLNEMDMASLMHLMAAWTAGTLMGTGLAIKGIRYAVDHSNPNADFSEFVKNYFIGIGDPRTYIPNGLLNKFKSKLNSVLRKGPAQESVGEGILGFKSKKEKEDAKRRDQERKEWLSKTNKDKPVKETGPKTEATKKVATKAVKVSDVTQAIKHLEKLATIWANDKHDAVRQADSRGVRRVVHALQQNKIDLARRIFSSLDTEVRDHFFPGTFSRSKEGYEFTPVARAMARIMNVELNEAVQEAEYRKEKFKGKLWKPEKRVDDMGFSAGFSKEPAGDLEKQKDDPLSRRHVHSYTVTRGERKGKMDKGDIFRRKREIQRTLAGESEMGEAGLKKKSEKPKTDDTNLESLKMVLDNGEAGIEGEDFHYDGDNVVAHNIRAAGKVLRAINTSGLFSKQAIVIKKGEEPVIGFDTAGDAKVVFQDTIGPEHEEMDVEIKTDASGKFYLYTNGKRNVRDFDKLTHAKRYVSKLDNQLRTTHQIGKVTHTDTEEE